jgi:hypothetical protein
MCGLLGVARSSYYAWRERTETPTQARRRELGAHVRRVFDESRATFGCRRVAAALNREGHECSVGLVADLMRELGLKAVQPRAYKRTTIPGEQPVESADLIGRDFDPASGAPGERLVGDITYLRTGEGWLYLATVIDLATRMVIGWQLADHLRTSLVVDALQMGIDAGLLAPDAIFHSDRGCQGGFKWRSQHLGVEVSGGASRGSDDGEDGAAGDAVAGSAAGVAAGASAAVLGGDRTGNGERGRGCCGGRVSRGGVAAVPRERWYAPARFCWCVRAVPVVRRAGGDRDPARAGLGCPRGGAPVGPVAVDDFPRAAA